VRPGRSVLRRSRVDLGRRAGEEGRDVVAETHHTRAIVAAGPLVTLVAIWAFVTLRALVTLRTILAFGVLLGRAVRAFGSLGGPGPLGALLALGLALSAGGTARCLLRRLIPAGFLGRAGSGGWGRGLRGFRRTGMGPFRTSAALAARTLARS
jgi:hypothetical protein